MVIDYLKEQITANFGHLPTQDQQKAIDLLAQFILSPETHRVFVLRGFAGTGKTSLLAAVVKTLEQLERPCVLMAPTGRAAKVFSLYADHPAYTIHKRIYRQKSIDQDSIFSLSFNMLRRVFFVVDEASMISNTQDYASQHSSLLDDLISFVYAGDQQCRLILVGDTAQLPPVGEAESPALQADVLRSYGLDVMQTTLRQIVRQQEASGILWNATVLRRLIDTEQVFDLPKIRFFGFKDVRNVPGDELIDTLSNCYARYGLDETMVVCRSNKRAIVYNNGIRAQILGCEEELSGQDLVMIAKNNYYWTAPSNSPEWGRTPAPEGEELKIRAKYQTADPALYDLLKEYSLRHRKFPTEGETAMWSILNSRQLGTKFRRQHIIADFIVDFVSIKHKLVIEVDGGYHFSSEQQKLDRMRTDILSELGYTELWFTNEEIISAPEQVKEKILKEMSKHPDGVLPHSGESEGANLSFLANGDIAVVLRIHNQRELYGFHFADCTLRLPDYDDQEVEATVLLDTLHAEAPALTREQQQLLFDRIMEDYADIPLKRDRLKKMKEDPYFNAVQLKYAYAVTCHKAQGGQWSHIFIDQGYMTDDMLGPDYFRWLYTALTRATDTVYFVNWRDVQTMEESTI